MLSDSDREQAALGAAILSRLVLAPDHGAGFRRDPDTGFVYYSSEWLNDPPRLEGTSPDLDQGYPNIDP